MTDSFVPRLLARYVKGIDHIAVAITDLKHAIDFYSRMLGFSLHERRRTEGKTTGMVSAVMKAGPVTVVLLQGTSAESQVSKYVDRYGPGVQHVAFQVENLPEAAEELKVAGLEYDTDIINSPGLRQIFTSRDPSSGMMYEFIERMGGDFSDESVQNLFEQLEKKGAF